MQAAENRPSTFLGQLLVAGLLVAGSIFLLRSLRPKPSPALEISRPQFQPPQTQEAVHAQAEAQAGQAHSTAPVSQPVFDDAVPTFRGHNRISQYFDDDGGLI